MKAPASGRVLKSRERVPKPVGAKLFHDFRNPSLAVIAVEALEDGLAVFLYTD